MERDPTTAVKQREILPRRRPEGDLAAQATPICFSRYFSSGRV